MYTNPKTFLTNDASKRSYIIFYFNGKRIRIYNGKILNLSINPNTSKNLKEKERLLNKLSYEVLKALESGWNPNAITTKVEIPEKNFKSIESAFNEVLEEKLNMPYSITYKTDLKRIHTHFMSFLNKEAKSSNIEVLNSRMLEDFLTKYNSSATYYMTKRRTLGVFISEFVRKKYISTNFIKETKKQKPKAVLHKIYTDDQLKSILKYLEINYPNLHIACLLAYGCFLRPHQEARLLKKSHINDTITEIHLSGNENKSGRVRIVHIPTYVKIFLEERLKSLKTLESNVLSTMEEPFNIGYLNKQWSRAKKKMLANGIIEKNQTIYSFRHTAVVNVYKKTKDLHILQRLLQHSNMIVTLNYLRGLGEIEMEDLKDSLPELEL